MRCTRDELGEDVADVRVGATMRKYGGSMGRPAVGALYLAAMIVVVVGVDVLFFRGQFWERLAANVGIVLLFVAFYFRFLRHA